MKDVGYLARRRYFSTTSAIQGVSRYLQAVANAVSSGKVSYAVFTEGRGWDQLRLNPELRAAIGDICRLERSLGHYRPYCSKPEGDAGRPSTVVRN